MNLWYTLLPLFLQQVVAEDQIYNRVVLIVDEGISDPIERFIGTGNVLNERWVLALDQIINPQADLVVITGHEVSIDIAKNKNKYRVIDVWNQIDEAKPEQALTLLETLVDIKFNDLSIGGTMFYHFTPKAQLSNCELVTWNLDLRKKKWKQNRIPVNLVDNPTTCKTDTDQQSCVSALNTKNLLNSCADLGAPLVCNVSLEGINLAEEANQCNKPPAASVSKVYIFGQDSSILPFLYGREKRQASNETSEDPSSEATSESSEESTKLGKHWQFVLKSARLEPGDVSYNNDYLVKSPDYEIQNMDMNPSDREEYSDYLKNVVLRMRKPCLLGGKIISSNIKLFNRTMHICLLLFSYFLLTII
nr:PREDICTED: uncharacterized protein LOC107397843 isoform X3 [Tribolium castaneum]|eukprot:XP_015835010.1 PREDICTED: uncharacterized protein LOC107397843 isoform X3 [Tribolium castaneum]